jgi:hypothetical protein
MADEPKAKNDKQELMDTFFETHSFDEEPTDFMDEPLETDEPGEIEEEVAMSEGEIRDTGLTIDLPFESGFADPQEIEYDEGIDADDWEAPEGWQDQVIAQSKKYLARDVTDDDNSPKEGE